MDPEESSGEMGDTDDQQNMLCVPVESIGQSTEGEPIEATIKGTISSVRDGNAYISVAEMNGQPVMSEQEEGEPDESDMRAMAQKADDSGNY